MASWGSARRVGLAAVAASCLGATALVACDPPGATFTVNTTVDGVDANPGDGICEITPGEGDCSLRAAVMESNATPTAGTTGNTIELGDGNTYVLTIPGANEDASATGDLDFSESVSLLGHSTIDGNHLDRVLDVHAGTLFADGPTVRDGRAIFDDTTTSVGGDLRVASGTAAFMLNTVFTDGTAFEGGAVYSAGDTRFESSTVQNSQAIGRVRSDGVILFARGGAFRTNGGQLQLLRSSVTNNGLVTAGDGAAIAGQSLVKIVASTISGNLASLPGAFASAISLYPSSGTASLLESTVSNNAGPAVFSTAASGGPSGGIVLIGTSVADNSGPVIGFNSAVTLGGSGIQTFAAACQSIPTSFGYNVVSDSSCSLAGTGDVQGLSPLLGPVADNGGATLTNLPFKNSPLLHKIPAGTPQLCEAAPSTDQRDQPRPTAGFCNSGSVEGNSPRNGITITPPA